jgi:hypothetical protein
MTRIIKISRARAFALIPAAAALALAAGCRVDVNVDEMHMTGKEPAEPPAVDDKTVILFDGHSWDGWKTKDAQASAWKVQPDGSVQASGGDAVSTEEFGDFQLHVEFYCPPAPGKEGQAKSNSGVYVHGRYEVQVLDSFGEAPADNLCGGIYKIAAPLTNASKPAGHWQSYDIIFRAPRFDDQKKVVEQPRITVLHNGVAIHNNVVLPNTTAGGIDRDMVRQGPILLQDHGDPVRYRNIWIRKL